MLKIFLCFTALLIPVNAVSNTKSLDGIAAIVNDGIITKSELARQMRVVELQFQQSGKAIPDKKALHKQVLEHLINIQVQLQLAKKTGIQVDDITLDNTIEKIAKENQMTVTQLRRAVGEQGIDFQVYRDNIRQQLMVSQLQQRDLLHEIQISEQEVNQFLQSPNGLGAMAAEYHLGHILISLPESPSPEELDIAKEKAKQIIIKLREGKDFSQIALVDSTGEHALNGGDLGWRKLPELPTIFEKIVPRLRINDIPDPIRSPSGLHIIKLLDKRSSGQQLGQKTLVRHILIKTNAVISDNEAKAKLGMLRQKILKGEDFAQLAKTHSVDLASANNGGSLGWVSKEVLVPEFSAMMESLSQNDISEPFKTAFGWHIMQVLERKSPSSDETALKQKAREMLQQRKFQEKLEIWARQLRDEAYVKMDDET